MWCPVCRRRDSHTGSRMERENLPGVDGFVVARKRGGEGGGGGRGRWTGKNRADPLGVVEGDTNPERPMMDQRKAATPPPPTQGRKTGSNMQNKPPRQRPRTIERAHL